MAKNLILPIAYALAQLAVQQASAQFADNFSDSNFTVNPTWTGNTTAWTVNSALRLQSNDTIANSSFYLSTASKLATSVQWELYVQLAFNTSSANYVDIYLTASAADISQAATTGYFVRLGNTSDNICLYRKDAFGISTLLINGTAGILNTSNNILKLKVIRDAAHHWTLLRDLSGTGNNYISEGAATDSTYTSSSFFGLLVKQSTASFFRKHFFDDIVVKPYTPDTIPPVVVSATAVTGNTLEVLYSEPVDMTTCQATGNYFADNGIGFPDSAARDSANNALVHLYFSTPFPNGVACTLAVSHVQDLAGNTMRNGNVPFSFYTVQPYDVVIDEIMADPNPPVGLPAVEFIELRNVSRQALDLYGWRAGDSVGYATINTHFLLQPDSFVIVSASSTAAALAYYGSTIGVSNFPTLNNDGDRLYLRSGQGRTIHAVDYTLAWYRNDIKSKGGWTLEMIDTRNPCGGYSNWAASIDPKGGTPGRKNSVDAINHDTVPPALVSAFASDSVTVTLLFDEPLDSVGASNPAAYSINGGIGTAFAAMPAAPLFNSVQLQLPAPLAAGAIYTVTANGVGDCSGNTIAGYNTTRAGIASIPDSGDIIINEVLFNPRPGGVDYIELYNRSNKIVNLKGCYISNRAADGTLNPPKSISAANRLLFPQDFMVVTEDPSIVQQQYLCKNPDAFAIVAGMPSYPNDKGDVIILNEQGKITDELRYDQQWQFKLIDNNEGVALERIDYNQPTQNQANWHSAATNVGYGTPTYQNSQYRADPPEAGMITVLPAIFSPDNDGIDDVATVSYRFPQQGYVCNITVFDAVGRPVRSLTHNAICGITGYFRWDGLDDKGRKLPIGVYVVYTEAFNLGGTTKRWKQAITLARRL